MVHNHCYICNNSVNSETKDDIRDKYYNVIGYKLYAGSNLCYICVHMTQKLWSFKTACVNRGFDVQYGCEEELNWSLLFRLTKDTEKLHNIEISKKIDITIVCQDDRCKDDESPHINIESADHDVIQDLCIKEKPLATEQNDNEINEDSYNTEIENFNQYSDNYTALDMKDEDNRSVINDDIHDDICDEHNEDITYEDDNVDPSAVQELETNEYTIQNEEELEIKKKKNKKSKKNKFKKTVLTYEEQKGALEAQRKEKKYLEAEFKCHSCALGFLFKDSYQSHMVRHEESNGQHSCGVCGLRFATHNIRSMHVALHAERYTCGKCGAGVKRPHRTKHTRLCWGVNCDPVSCHLCGKVFKDPTGLQQHVKRFHLAKTNKRTYTCNTCGKTYTDQGALRTHMIKHTNRRWQCDQCPSTFGSAHTLRQHRAVHSTDDKHYCADCNTWYKTRKHLREHLRNSLKHQQLSYECLLCARECSTRQALLAHMDTHSGRKPHACSLCPARYSTRKSLVRHARIHTQYVPTKEFVCHLCGKTYRGKSKLTRHLRDVCESSKQDQQFNNVFNDNSMCYVMDKT